MIMHTPLYDEIASFEPVGIQEIQDQKVMLEYITSFDNILSRDNHFAHMSASPWIINKDASKVLMIHHNIYQSWGWCGGHCDGDEQLLEVALKEGKEETGLKELIALDSQIMALDILPVPSHMKHGCFISAHVHLNVTYLCMADEHAPIHCKWDENSGVKWVDVNEVLDIVSEEDMKAVYTKLMEKVKIRTMDV